MLWSTAVVAVTAAVAAGAALLPPLLREIAWTLARACAIAVAAYAAIVALSMRGRH